MKNVVIVSVIVCVCVIGLLMTRSSTQGQQVNKTDINDVPTLVNREQITQKEKNYSIEYKKLYPEQTKKLGEVADSARENGVTSEVGMALGVPQIPTLGPPPTAIEFIRNLTCKADAIVLGEVKSKASHLTEDETWIYTSYEFSVKEVVKDNLFSLIKAEDTIEITRPGGLIELDNQVIRITDRLYDPLEKNEQYLVFLKFVPLTQGYLVSSAKGDFILQKDKLKSLSKIGISYYLKDFDDYKTLTKEIRKFGLSECLQTINGGN